jgi:hypothetical protein
MGRFAAFHDRSVPAVIAKTSCSSRPRLARRIAGAHGAVRRRVLDVSAVEQARRNRAGDLDSEELVELSPRAGDHDRGVRMTDLRARWDRYKTDLCVVPSVGLTLDVSCMGHDDAFLERMRAPMEKAFDEMEALEKGAIANPD